MNKRKLIFILLIIFIIIAIGVFVWIKYYPRGENKNDNGNQVEVVSPLCEKFKEISSGIICDKAIEIALNSYPGEAYGVEMAKRSFPGEENVRELWSVRINLKEPIETPDEKIKSLINVLVDKNTGSVSFIEFI